MGILHHRGSHSLVAHESAQDGRAQHNAREDASVAVALEPQPKKKKEKKEGRKEGRKEERKKKKMMMTTMMKEEK